MGLINLKTSPYDIATAAIADASFMCRRQHGDAPDVVIVGRTDLTFPYVPSHLNYVLVELLKNSMRATVETHGVDNMPPIKIVIADGEDNEDVSSSSYVMCIAYLYGLYGSDYSLSNLFYITIVLHLGGDQSI